MTPAGVALAAGAGTRLRPLTRLRPKALCPVDGRPLLEHALQRLEPLCGAGSDRLAVNAHHLGEQIAQHCSHRAHVSMEQPRALGTAGALGALRDWLDGRDVLVTNADAYLPHGLDGFLDGWDGERSRLLCTPTAECGDLVAAHVRYVGACLLPWAAVRRLPAEPSGLYEVLWRGQQARGGLELVTTTATAIDCGTPADYLRANLHASGGEPVIGEGATVLGRLTRAVVWDGAWVGRHEHLVEVIRAGSRDDPVTVPATPTHDQ